MPPLSPSAQKVQDALRALGLANEVQESEHPTRTAAEAAKLVGCQVGQIAKSLVFRGARTGQPVLVITSGANTVNEFRVGMYLKEALAKAPAAFVREVTGFAIGGVPPLAHARPLATFIDEAPAPSPIWTGSRPWRFSLLTSFKTKSAPTWQTEANASLPRTLTTWIRSWS